MNPRLISIQAGLPRVVKWQGQDVRTGIFKSPVGRRVQLRALNLEGDKQGDLSVHGGPNKAVYAYPSEHYEYWREELPEEELPWGSFGENFTIEGLREHDVFVGDRFRIGTAEVIVTQPRMPCYKLNLKFNRHDMLKRFLRSQRFGFYLRVLQEGEVGAGDEMVLLGRDERGVPIAGMISRYVSRKLEDAG